MADRLSTLAVEINKHFGVVKSALESAFDHSCEIGRLLSEAKDTVAHGEWLQWVEDNCPFSSRQAQKYMRVFRHREEIASKNTAEQNLDLMLSGIATPVLSVRDVKPEPDEEPRIIRVHAITEPNENYAIPTRSHYGPTSTDTSPTVVQSVTATVSHLAELANCFDQMQRAIEELAELSEKRRKKISRWLELIVAELQAE